HVEDRRRNKQQTRDEPAQDRLRILEDSAERGDGRLESTARGCSWFLFRNQKEKGDADQKTEDAHANPKNIPTETGSDQWSNNELTGGTAGHAEHLRRADQRRGFGRRK